MLGDSITEGYGTTDDSCSFAFDLQDMLHMKAYEVAHGGYRTDQMLTRLPEVLAHNPSLVVIELGTNDVRYDKPLKQFQSDYKAILTGLWNIPHVCTTVWPSPGYESPALLQGYNDIIRTLCGVRTADITSLATVANTNSENWHPNNQGAFAIACAVSQAFFLTPRQKRIHP